jgi:hypothetical protein
MVEAKSKKRRTCGCVKKINKQLMKTGMELDDRLLFTFGASTAKCGKESPIVQLRWINKNRKAKLPSYMVCTFCPFCGKEK